MKKIVKILAVVTPLFFIGCGSSSSNSTEDSGIKGGEMVVDFSASRMKKLLVDQGMITEKETVFGYKAYKIPYITTDDRSLELNASGLLVIPTGVPSIVEESGLSMVSDGHGAIFKNIDAPTVHASTYGTPTGAPILLTSIGGFATLQADYIGFGDSNRHYHPSGLKKSSANSVVDFIKQVKIFAKENNIKLNQQLFLTGFSEGGYTTMASLKKVEEEVTNLSVSMAIPMASTYSMKKRSDKELLINPASDANTAYAYARAYDIELSSIFNEPYLSRIPTLFDGTNSMEEINKQLTTKATGEGGLFNETISDADWLKKAIVENSVGSWGAETTIRLINCEGDEVAPFSEANVTIGEMREMGAENIEIISLEKRLGLSQKLGHMECAVPLYKLATEIFADERKATIGY